MFSLADVQQYRLTNRDIQMRVAEVGSGPLVLMLHGWPESWYSWRHQMLALAERGYRVVTPDMPGYGGTDRLSNIADYNIQNIADYVVELVRLLGEERTVLVGHDWGAAIAWDLVLLYPEHFSHLVNLSVPLRRRSERPPMEVLGEKFGERFFYQLYFQEPGVAEAEFDADPRAILSRLYCSPDTPRHPPEVTDKRAAAGGWTSRLGAPRELPEWLSQEDLDFYVAEFSRAGFTGGINYYRNIDRNWELMAPYRDQTIDLPTLFIAGDKDMVIQKATRDQLWELMAPRVPGLADVVLVPEAGHWIQQEAPDVVNEQIIEFLRTHAG